MIGSLIGAGVGAAASIYGGIKASKAMKKLRADIEERKRKNQAWYDRRYNEDATQRADAQALLARTEESIRKRNRQAAATKAVMGGTDESVAATKSANNEALAQVMGNVAANAEARKDSIEARYQQRESELDSMLGNLDLQKAQAIGQATQGVAQAGAGLAGAF